MPVKMSHYWSSCANETEAVTDQKWRESHGEVHALHLSRKSCTHCNQRAHLATSIILFTADLGLKQ